MGLSYWKVKDKSEAAFCSIFRKGNNLDITRQLCGAICMRPTKILKLRDDSPSDELSFELDFLATLTLDERFAMMVQRSDEIKKILMKNGNYKSSEIIKRT